MADQGVRLDPAFEDVVRQVRAVRFRSDLAVAELDPPRGLAPNAFALAAEVRPENPDSASGYGSGRLVLLRDPTEPSPWAGAWRLVSFAQAPLEPDLARDPLLAEVAWSWLVDALSSHGARHHALAGTTTTTLSQGFGDLAGSQHTAMIELRGSWSPDGDWPAHIEAWAEATCMLAGLPPGTEEVARLRPKGPVS